MSKCVLHKSQQAIPERLAEIKLFSSATCVHEQALNGRLMAWSSHLWKNNVIYMKK